MDMNAKLTESACTHGHAGTSADKKMFIDTFLPKSAKKG